MCRNTFGWCCGLIGCPRIAEVLGLDCLVNVESGSLSGPLADPYITVPQKLADDMALLCHEAVRWFHNPEHVFLGDADIGPIPDEVVRERIAGYQEELDKEWKRERRAEEIKGEGPFFRYELVKLPFPHQRALCERWEAVFNQWLQEHPGWKVTPDGFISPPPKTQV